MKPRVIGLLVFALALAFTTIAAGQELASIPTGSGFIGPLFPAEGVQAVQYTVEVTGRTSPIRGSSRDHFLSFSGPVSIPGVSLGPGTYVFRVLAPSVMQVTDVDHRLVYGMFFVSPVNRVVATATHEVRLERTTAGTPLRLVGLFTPESLTGYEPLYRAPSSCERILRDLMLPTAMCEGTISD